MLQYRWKPDWQTRKNNLNALRDLRVTGQTNDMTDDKSASFRSLPPFMTIQWIRSERIDLQADFTQCF
jgi:hypothetical protein